MEPYGRFAPVKALHAFYDFIHGTALAAYKAFYLGGTVLRYEGGYAKCDASCKTHS